MNWIRAPEGSQVLFGDVVSRHDCGGQADDLVVLDALPARKVVDPAMDLGQLGAHEGSKALFPEVGDGAGAESALQYNGENDLADFGEEALQAGEQTQAGTEAGGSM